MKLDNILWGLVALVASATVAQVWIVITPAQAEQATLKDDVQYIRGRVDELYNIVSGKH